MSGKTRWALATLMVTSFGCSLAGGIPEGTVSGVPEPGPATIGPSDSADPTDFEDVPNPLVVTVHLEENAFEFPEIDPNDPNFDPSTIFPPGFDPENPDYSLLFGPKAVYGDVGPEGGTIEATDANGALYRLIVPPGAVEVPISIGLTPVSGIDGLPLSGGLLAAAEVTPEGIEFDPPLRLEILLPDEVSLPAGDLRLMGFAVTPVNEGSEFYFVPRLETGLSRSPSSGGGLMRPDSYHPVMSLVARDGGTYGTATGTRAEVRAAGQRRPSRSSHRTTSAVALEEEELAPIPPPRPVEERIARKAAAAGTTDQFLEVLEDLQAYLDAGGTRADAIWDEVLVNTKVLFEKTKGRCLTRDGYLAAGIATRMTFADEGTFWSQLRDRYTKKYGERSLDDARRYAQRCRLRLSIDSRVSWNLSDAGVKISYDSTTQVTPLMMRYQGGPVLIGYGLVIPSRVETKIEGCIETQLNPKPNEYIRIAIQPTFGADGYPVWYHLVNFGGGGLSYSLTQQCRFEDAPSTSTVTRGAGGLWGGLFVDARRGDVLISIRAISPPPETGEVAREAFKGTPTGISGATIVEDTVFRVIVGEP